MVGAVTAVIPYKAKARPRCSGGNVSARIACAIGWSPPPPAPWTIRAKSNRGRLGAMPQNRELAVKRKIQVMKKRLRPITLASQPLIGNTMALDTRYEVSTQVLSSLLAPRLPAMYGRATLAMLVSSTSMNAANETALPINQGLNFGCHAWSRLASSATAPGSNGVAVLSIACILNHPGQRTLTTGSTDMPGPSG